jgi:hypothetical protein
MRASEEEFMDDPTQRMPPAAQQQPPPARARRAWVLPAMLGGLVLVGVLAAATVIAGPDPDRRAVDSAVDSAVDGAATGDAASLDALFEFTANDRPLRHGPMGHGPLRLREGEKVLAGSVSSVADGQLVVRKDNGAEVAVPTDGDTRVYGARNKTLSDLQAGERVIVRVGSDGVAAGVLAVRAHAAGTVTALDGDRATVVRAGGLSTVLDLSGVTERPAVGTVVVAVGTATQDGATLKVEQIRQLPTVS